LSAWRRIRGRFWNGETGRALRGYPEAQVVALYLISCESSHGSGLYRLAIPTLAHEIGIPLEGASKGLARVAATGFCTYDLASETVFVHSMAREQIGDALRPADNQRKGLIRHLKEMNDSPLLGAWLNTYGDAYGIELEAPSKPLPSPFGGGPEQFPDPLRSKEKEKEKEKEKDLRAETGADPSRFRSLLGWYRLTSEGEDGQSAPGPAVVLSQAAAGALGKHMRSRRVALGVSQRDLAAKVAHPAFGPRDLGRSERGEFDPGQGTWIAWDQALAKLESAKDPPNPDHQRFVDAFTALWRQEHGPGATGPTWSNGRHHAALRAALSEHGLDGLLSRARNLFASPVGVWPINAQADKDLATLLGHLDKFVSVRQRGPQARTASTVATPQEHRNDPGPEWANG